MNLPLSNGVIRSWRTADLDSLVEHANNYNIWINVRDRFPYPYTKRHGRAFIKAARSMRPETYFTIAIDDEAVGGIGFNLQRDVDRVSAEIGYWLGEPYWGRGIATEALRAVTAYAFDRHELTRLFALPFARNVGSCRVLEKAGYIKEATLGRSAIKDGIILDQVQYAFIR